MAFSVPSVMVGNRAFLLAVTIGAALTFQVTDAGAAGLGVAQDFNGFVLGDAALTDATLLNSSTAGRLAVGGNLVASSYGVNTANLPVPPPALIVGGNLTYTNGQVNGSAVVGGTASTTGVTFTGGITTSSPVPVDFAAARSFYELNSTYLGGLAANGAVTSAFGTLTLTGTNASLNIFTVDGSALASINSYIITAPVGSTVLINVSGANPILQNAGFTVNGVSQQAVLYNFFEAATLTTSSIGIRGSVLAPFADVFASNGDLFGTLIASTLQDRGTNQNTLALRNFAFTGDDLQLIPEPSSTGALLLVGLLGSRLARRRSLARHR